MPHAFVALLLAAREELMLATKFSDFVELVYLKGKAVSIDAFISKYIRVAAGGEFYTPRWNYEEIPVEAIKLDKISLGHKIGTAGADGQPKPVEDKLIEDNMDRILKENVLPEDQEIIPQGEGLLLDPSLLKDLDKEAAMNTGKSKSTKGKKAKADNDPLMGDYKSVKKAGTKDGSSKPSAKKGGDDILSDMPKPDKKTSGGKAIGSSRDGKVVDSNRTFSLPQSDTVREPSKKKPGDKTNKSSKRSGAEEGGAGEEQSGVKKSDSKKNIRKPASKSKDKDKDKSESPAPSKRKVPPPPKKKK